MGEAFGEGAPRRILDMLGSIEIRFTGGQRDDVDSGRLHFGGARLGGHRGGRFDCSDAAIELDHGASPALSGERAPILSTRR
jgi:hypothetical protein